MINVSVSLDERENLSERTKAGVARARDEREHIGPPFCEINWRKVDEYRARGYRSQPFDFKGDGMD